MKLLTFPIRLLFRLVLLPLKLVLAAAGITFRTGFKVGTLPVKGGYVAGRALGLKALVLFAAGVALGVVVGRRLGAAGAELATSSFGAAADNGSGPIAVATLVEDTLEVVDTPDGPVMAIVEDTIEVVETPDGEIVTETVTVTELDEDEAEAVLEAVEAEIAAEEAAELEDEIEAEIDQALGFTAGELGVDSDSDPAS